MDAPTEANLHLYIQELEKHEVCTLVRVCDPTYDKKRLQEINIEVHDWPFADGDAPPSSVINNWLDLVENIFGSASKKGPNATIAVHCVAGLGRAPLLVALALIERGMDSMDAVEAIRKRRRGAINTRQLKYIESYKRTRADKKNCLVM